MDGKENIGKHAKSQLSFVGDWFYHEHYRARRVMNRHQLEGSSLPAIFPVSSPGLAVLLREFRVGLRHAAIKKRRALLSNDKVALDASKFKTTAKNIFRPCGQIHRPGLESSQVLSLAAVSMCGTN